MSVLISPSDFIGKYVLPGTPLEVVLKQQLIDEVETRWMTNLLGSVEATALLADANANGGVPVLAPYLVIFNALQLEDYCNDEWELYSGGLKEMLINVVYAQWLNEKAIQSTTIGLKKINSTNSSNVHGQTFKLKNNINLAVNNYRVIQKYIDTNIADYPDYKGINKKYTSPF